MASGAFGASFFKPQASSGPAQPAPASSSGWFTASQPNQQQPQAQETGQNQQPSLAQSTQSPQATQPAFFNSLLERGKKRPFASTSQDNSYGELPSLQLGLDDIRRKARELGAQDSKTRQAGRDQKA
jgi:nuclear pore complex protein Nup93